jgi:hypothetical protein
LASTIVACSTIAGFSLVQHQASRWEQAVTPI